MDMTKLRVFGLLLASIAAGIMPSASAQDRLFGNEAKQKAEALLKQMTVYEKVGQLNESSGIVMPGIATEKPDDLIAKGGGPSGQTSTNLPPPSLPPVTQSTCATPAASNPVGGGGIYTQIAISPPIRRFLRCRPISSRARGSGGIEAEFSHPITTSAIPSRRKRPASRS